MNAPTFDLKTIDYLTGGKLGVHDTQCPLCSPTRKPANRRKRVLRIWRLSPDFASYHCVHCLADGYARDGEAAHLDQAARDRVRREAAERDRAATAERLGKARWLWSRRRPPLVGSIAERYLREARRYPGPLPATLGFLPARGKHGPAMIAAFGIPTEPEPGRLRTADDEVRGIHITRLSTDGLAKAGTGADKIMVGRSVGWPIVLAPPNDLLGLAVTEGIEDGLSAFEATGLGCWVAGSASRMPALADAIPAYIESITIFAHADGDGQRGAHELARRLTGRVLEVRIASAEEEGRLG